MRSADLTAAAERLGAAASSLEADGAAYDLSRHAVGDGAAAARDDWAGPDTDRCHAAIDAYLGSLPALGSLCTVAARTLRSWSLRASELAAELAVVEAAMARLSADGADGVDELERVRLGAARNRLAHLRGRWIYESNAFAGDLSPAISAAVLVRDARVEGLPVPNEVISGFMAAGASVGGDGYGWMSADALERWLAATADDEDEDDDTGGEPEPLSIVDLLTQFQHMAGPWDNSWWTPDQGIDGAGIDDSSEFGEWFLDQRAEHTYGGGSHWSLGGFTATYDGAGGTTLDLGLPEHIDFPDDVEHDGVVVTVLGRSGTMAPSYLSGEPTTEERIWTAIGWTAAETAVCAPFGPFGQFACGAGVNFIADEVSDAGDGTTIVPSVVLVTPIDFRGTVVGDPVVVEANVTVVASADEMAEVQIAEYEHEQAAPTNTVVLDNGQIAVIQGDNPDPGPSTLPQTGNTFVVMRSVENIGEF